MSGGSVKTAIGLYSLVFTVGLAFAIATFASGAVLRASRLAQVETLRRELSALSSQRSLPDLLQAVDQHSSHSTAKVGVVTSHQSFEGVDLERARRALKTPDPETGLFAELANIPSEEAYLLFPADRTISPGIAQLEIQRLLLVGLIAALVFGLILTLLIIRLVLPPLASLQQAAQALELDPEGLTSSDAPNEIAQIAQTFRGTIRALNQDRLEIKRQHQELEEMQSSLIRASKLASVGRLAAGIAHEIGNPLSAVLGYLSILRGSLDEKERQEILARTTDQLNRIHETIRKLLTYARQEEVTEAPSAVSLRAVLADTWLLLGAHPSMRNVSVDDQISGRGDLVLAHAMPLQQVLVNLLLNAAQAMEAKGSGRIRLWQEIEGRDLKLFVEDNGPGIPTEKLEQVFDPFYTTKAPGEGTGLGLAVSRSLVERMEGELVASRAESGGARFTIRLRLVGVGEEAPGLL